MRTFLWIAVVAAAIILPGRAWCQQSDQGTDKGSTPQTITLASDSGQTPASQQDSLGDAARKAREQKKDSAKGIKVFTNDDVRASGVAAAVDSTSAATPHADATGTSAPTGKDEKAWREKFAQLRSKLDRDQEELAVMQRELGVLDLQYYNDPVKAMQQQLTRSDINEKTAKIDAKKKAIEADEQAIDDAQDDLRKAGGEPGWAR
jgi:chromosome segregation ATPase